jgi:hypothetical protein
MKKTYQQPETLAISVELESMIAQSPVEKGFSLSGAHSTNATSGNLGRERGTSTQDDIDELW